jgi:predicted RNase H-like HicB family nuclease
MSATGTPIEFTVRIHHEPDDEFSLWAEVEELPGCFASGRNMDELQAALSEAVSQYLSEPGHETHVELEVTEQRVRATTVAA